MDKLMAALSGLSLVVYLVFITVLNIQFDRNCGDYLKRAADANTIEICITEIQRAVNYMDANNLTSGYTSVLYTTPDEDIGFWYVNVTTTLNELKELNIKEKSGEIRLTPVDKSNQLIKVRETLIDQGEQTNVTLPMGISRFPSNTLFALWGILSFIFTLVFGGFALRDTF